MSSMDPGDRANGRRFAIDLSSKFRFFWHVQFFYFASGWEGEKQHVAIFLDSLPFWHFPILLHFKTSLTCSSHLCFHPTCSHGRKFSITVEGLDDDLADIACRIFFEEVIGAKTPRDLVIVTMAESLKPGLFEMGVSKNRGTPKWMVYNGNTQMLGVPFF